jgi:hypothetical protein
MNNKTMLKISEFAPYFSKKGFDIKTDKNSYSKKKDNHHQKDELFYNFYTNIKMIENIHDALNGFNERDEKIKLAEKLEQMKFKNKDEIMNNLIYDKKIKLFTLDIICKLMNVHVIYIYDNLFVKMKYNETKPIIIDNKANILENFDLDKLEKMYEVHLEKPIKAVSSYKLAELKDFAEKINISTDKLKKQDIYNEIKTYLSSHNF